MGITRFLWANSSRTYPLYHATFETRLSNNSDAFFDFHPYQKSTKRKRIATTETHIHSQRWICCLARRVAEHSRFVDRRSWTDKLLGSYEWRGGDYMLCVNANCVVRVSVGYVDWVSLILQLSPLFPPFIQSSGVLLESNHCLLLFREYVAPHTHRSGEIGVRCVSQYSIKVALDRHHNM